MERIFLTKEQALGLLAKCKSIHTFRSGTGMLIGCDWRREELVKTINDLPDDRIEIGGEQCRKMGHGLVLWTSETDPLFVEVDDSLISKMDTLTHDK